MKNKVFEQKFGAFWSLLNRTLTLPEQQALLPRTLQELSLAREELQVIWEELQRQIEESAVVLRALEIKSRHYRELFDFSPDGVLVTDGLGIIKEANRTAEVLFRMNQWLVGNPMVVLVAKEDKTIFYSHLNLSNKEQGRKDFELLFAPPGGPPFFAEVTLFSKCDLESESVELWWTIRDITQRKQTEEMLRRYELLSSHSRDIILFMRRDNGRILEANAAATNAYGYSRDEMLSLTIQDLRASETQEQTTDQMAEADARGILFETVHRRKDGSTFPVEVSSRGKDTDTTRTLISVIRDITVRKKAEQALRQSEERYRSYIEVTGQLGWTTNADGEVLEDIPSWRRFTGQSEEEVMGWGWSKALHPEDLENAVRVWKDSVSTKNNYEVEYRVCRHDGIYRHFLARGVPVLKNDGEVQEWVGTCIDITERKQIEDAQKFLVQCGLPAWGDDFFKSLARYLSENLGMDYVCIDRLLEEGLAAKTEAIYFDGEFEDNLIYTLKDTPCGDVVEKTICCFPDGVRRLYPQDVVLQEMMAESYVGTILWSSKGQPIGLIAVIGRKPLANPQLAKSILKVVAVRAAGELERRETEEALWQRSLELHQLSETLEIQVRERTEELAKAYEDLRRISGKLLSAQEDERKRVAGEIHDTLGSCLSAVKFKVEDAMQRIRKTPTAAAEYLDPIIPLIRECVDDCRRIQADLRPPMLDDLGLLPTLSWFFRRFQSVYSTIAIEQEVGIEEEDVPLALKIVVFRVTQEAMNNIAKYSQADLVRHSLRQTDDKMVLDIQDNGQGFNLGKVFFPMGVRKGLGLTSMQERVELSGGLFAIESFKGKGTTIRAEWPLA